jgi:hypothetical protein
MGFFISELSRLQMLAGAFAHAGQKGQQLQVVMWWISFESSLDRIEMLCYCMRCKFGFQRICALYLTGISSQCLLEEVQKCG